VPGVSVIPDSAPVVYRGRFVFVASITCAFALLVFFRDFVFSRFTWIAADIGDGRLAIAILEHWWAVAHHKAWLLSPNFFWPERGVLGYSDALGLFAVPYSVARAFGLDRYLAFESTLIAVQAIGFASMTWLLRSFLRTSAAVALVGSVLFTLANICYATALSTHVQLMTVAFCPLLAALVCDSRRARVLGLTTRCSCSAAGAGTLLGLILFTSFYIGWFTVLFAAVTGAAWLAGVVMRDGAAAARSSWTRAVADSWRPCAVGAAAFALSLAPFALTYIPALQATGGRPFADTFSYMAGPLDTINVGPRNLLWGPLLEPLFAAIRQRVAEGEHQVGWPPLILLVTSWAAIHGLGGLGRPKPGQPADLRRFLAIVLAFSAGLLWFVSLNIGGHSLWILVFRFVPGAAAIRVPERIALVLNVAVILVVCTALDRLRVGKSGLRATAFWCLSALLIVEQLNLVQTHRIDRRAEREIFAKVQKPPLGCRAFFLSNAASPARPFFSNQIDAMLVARDTGLPTLNGYSGWTPSGWSLNFLDASYSLHVREWAVEHNIAHDLCSLDLRDGSWNMPSPVSESAVTIDIGTSQARHWRVTGAGARNAPALGPRGSISISSTGDASGAIIEGGSLARFNGFWMATDQFVIPAGARHIVLSFSDFNADDRAVLELNGNIIGNTAINGGSGPGVMCFTPSTPCPPYRFAPATKGTVTSNFVTGLNTLTIFVNNTGTASIASPIEGLRGTDSTAAQLSGWVTFETNGVANPGSSSGPAPN
jgi:hypothetical protein